jgi:MFS family permease
MNKRRSIALLVLAETAGMSVWFATAAVLPDLSREFTLGASQQGLLAAAVQAGFVLGALFVAVSGLADRLDPRRVIACCAILAGLANALMLAVPPDGWTAVLARTATGALLAGVYPVGMKIAAGWGVNDRGWLIGLLVAGLTLGKAAPYLAAFIGDVNWRVAIIATSVAAIAAGLGVTLAALGPFHARAARLRLDAVLLAWTNIRIRRAYLGYLGHMWELYAFWAWIGAASAASFAATLPPLEAERLGKLTAALAIALGAPFCALAGKLADRIGKAEVTIIAMSVSGLAALATALSFGGPIWLTLALALVWGLAVIPDSAQFSAIVADNAPPETAGSLLTFQTALGFGLTIFTVEIAPIIAGWLGWRTVLALLATGPFLGIVAMAGLRRARPAANPA